MPPTFQFGADGEPLITLDNGIKIVRRAKHEWHSRLDPADKAAFKLATQEDTGSKFLATWSVERVARWLADEIIRLGWSRIDSPTNVIIDVAEIIGYSNGQAVRRIKIVMSSGFAHGYPIEE